MLRRLLQRFAADERGMVAVIAALVVPIMIGGAALAIDSVKANATIEQLRSAAEAAATAAVHDLPDETTARATAISYANKNKPAGTTGEVMSDAEVVFGNWDDDTGTFDPAGSPVNAVRATASLSSTKGNAPKTFFGSTFGLSSLNLAQTAIATASGGVGVPCLLSLHPTAAKALNMSSNARIDLEHCGVHVTSTAVNAIDMSSNARIDADETCVAGGAKTSSNAKIVPAAITNCDPMDDPFATLAAPPYSANCTFTNTKVSANQSVTFPPGVYCGGLEVSSNSTVTFQPGIVVIKNGPLKISSNATIKGNGVGVFLTGSTAILNFSSNASVQITAPSSGPMAGMAFFQDRAFGSTHTHNLQSNAQGIINGAIYLPNATLDTDSNGRWGESSSCLVLIAAKFIFDSNGTFARDDDMSSCPWQEHRSGSKISRLVR